MDSYGELIVKLLLSVVLGGIVGYEREYKSRPAGLRTHILVCIGAALVQITAINYYRNSVIPGMDPMRMGAQVISGIGFLGAGTILKEGANIRGLTTAASIWAVGCIGLAVGTGLYIEAAAATILIYISLKGFKRIEGRIAKNRKYMSLEILADNTPGMIGSIGSLLGMKDILIDNIEMSEVNGDKTVIYMGIKLKYIIPAENIVDEIAKIEGVHKVVQL